jgi:hypothetical protein
VVNGQFTLNNLPLVNNLTGFKSLKTVNNSVTISYLNSITDFTGLEALEYVKGSLMLTYNALVTNLNGLGSLRNINYLQLNNMPLLTKLDGFSSLQSLKSLYLAYLDGMTGIDMGSFSVSSIEDVRISYLNLSEPFKFTGSSKAMSIGSVNLSTIKSPDIEIDVQGLAINKLTISGVSGGSALLKGNPVFDGGIEIAKNQDDMNLNIEGIKEVKSLTVSVYGSIEQTMNVPSIEKVKERLYYSVGNDSKVKANFTGLKEVGGEFAIAGGYTGSAPFPEVPKLKKIGRFTYGTGVLKKIDMPALETVSGNMSISTAWRNGTPVYQIEEINLPSIKTIEGTFTLFSSTSGIPNTTLTNLDFLSSLQSVEAVSITSQSALADFKGLAKAVNSITDKDSWTVSENGYNPTYEQAKAGQLVKP